MSRSARSAGASRPSIESASASAAAGWPRFVRTATSALATWDRRVESPIWSAMSMASRRWTSARSSSFSSRSASPIAQSPTTRAAGDNVIACDEFGGCCQRTRRRLVPSGQCLLREGQRLVDQVLRHMPHYLWVSGAAFRDQQAQQMTCRVVITRRPPWPNHPIPPRRPSRAERASQHCAHPERARRPSTGRGDPQRRAVSTT